MFGYLKIRRGPEQFKENLVLLLKIHSNKPHPQDKRFSTPPFLTPSYFLVSMSANISWSPSLSNCQFNWFRGVQELSSGPLQLTLCSWISSKCGTDRSPVHTDVHYFVLFVTMGQKNGDLGYADLGTTIA